MHCHCGINNKAPRCTFTNRCKPDVRPGAREESASPSWLSAPSWMPSTQERVYMEAWHWMWTDTISEVSQLQHTRKKNNNTWVEPLTGHCITSSTRQREQVWQNCKIQKNWCTVNVAPTIKHHGWHSRTPAEQRWYQVPGRSQRLLPG